MIYNMSPQLLPALQLWSHLFKVENENWQKGLRHQLTVNRSFTKAKKCKGAGWYWKLSENHSFFAPKKKASQCDQCNKTFSSIGGLNYHKNIVHEENVFFPIAMYKIISFVHGDTVQFA